MACWRKPWARVRSALSNLGSYSNAVWLWTGTLPLWASVSPSTVGAGRGQAVQAANAKHSGLCVHSLLESTQPAPPPCYLIVQMRQLRHGEVMSLVKVGLRCELTWWDTGEQGPILLSPSLALPHLCKPQDPIPEKACPLSHGKPWQVPRASNNSTTPGLTQPFIRAGDHAPSGPAAAQVGSPSQLRFRETLASPCPSPWPRPAWPASLGRLERRPRIPQVPPVPTCRPRGVPATERKLQDCQRRQRSYNLGLQRSNPGSAPPACVLEVFLTFLSRKRRG